MKHMQGAKAHKYTAIVDFRETYDVTPRRSPMERPKNVLSPEIIDMVAMKLQPLQVNTRDDSNRVNGKVNEGFT